MKLRGQSTTRSGSIECKYRRAVRIFEKAEQHGHHVRQRSDAEESIIGAPKRHESGFLGGLPYAR